MLAGMVSNGRRSTNCVRHIKTRLPKKSPGLLDSHTKPDFAINQPAFLIKTTEGNVCCGIVSPFSTRRLKRRFDGSAESRPSRYLILTSTRRWLSGADSLLEHLAQGLVYYGLVPDRTRERNKALPATLAIQTGSAGRAHPISKRQMG
jgi:hypothetical protein